MKRFYSLLLLIVASTALSFAQDTWTVAGTAPALNGTTDWAPSATENDMQSTDGVNFSLTVTNCTLTQGTEYKYKVVKNHAWGEEYPSSDKVFTVNETGVYTVVYSFNATTHAVSEQTTKTGGAVGADYYILAGSATLFSDEWSPTQQVNKLIYEGEGIWAKTYHNVYLNEGTIEWKLVKNGNVWIPDGMNNNLKIFVPDQGSYDVAFTYNEATNTPSAQLLKDGVPVDETVRGEGWPAEYGGVMLQGFYWNSFEDTKLTELQKQVDNISTYFDLIWLPNTGATGGEGMGYLPVYWLNHNSNFGRQNTLKKLIKSFNEKGTKVIEDVVLNHKAPKGENGSWVDFVNETWKYNGETYNITWSPADICRNDDGGYTNVVGASAEMIEQNGGWECTGANDEGDDFSGGRDLDHTSANVQENVKIYLKFLTRELGYSGFRLDMVKGYSPYYTKLYNKALMPEFCVGEFWDGYDAITSWIKGTGFTSAAFDFPLKYVFQDAFGGGNWGALANKGMAGSTEFQRYSVTFVDNHDTYENESRLVNNVLAANAFMLAMPGTPCVFLKHWQRYPIAIGNMILARKAAGITNQSPIIEQQAVDGGYYIKVQGTNGTVLCTSGFPSVNTDGFRRIASGQNFAFFLSENVTVTGLTDGNDDEEVKDMTVYIESETAPYIYSWNSSGQPTNGAWPGVKLTRTIQTLDGKQFWTRTFSTVPVNIVISNGGDKETNTDGEEIATGNNAIQSKNYEGLTHDTYIQFDVNNTNKETNTVDITSNYYVPQAVTLPECAKFIPNHLYCYFQGNKDYDSPCAWAWLGERNFCGTWPGVKLTRAGQDSEGHIVWLWDGGDFVDLFDTYSPSASLFPEAILFSNNGTPQTANFPFKNGGYYDATGLVGDVTTGLRPSTVGTPAVKSGVRFNLQGQRVGSDYRGLIIMDGRKVMNK